MLADSPQLNSKYDKNDDHHLLRLKDTFIHRQHLCLAFELLSVNLYELIKQNQFRGLSTTLVRVFAQQLLNALSLLNKAHLIHCDLKPENILLKKSVSPVTFQGRFLTVPSLESPIIKVIDFGSACDERQTVYTYIQSRFYRSPEVLLGLPYVLWSDLLCSLLILFLVTHLPLTCGLLGVSWWSSSWVYLCSLALRSTIKSVESLRCWVSHRPGCWRWASSRESSSKRHRTSSEERRTASRAWSSIPENTTRRNNRARSISQPQHWRRSSGVTQCLGKI
jgi:serine/threonine protein kinase